MFAEVDLLAWWSYAPAPEILDFFHAAEHLSAAADAILGKSSTKKHRWFERYRDRLSHDDVGVDATIRSLRHSRKSLPAGSEAAQVVRRVIRHISANRNRMRYAAFRARGLPISSGPAEAACETVVGNRLKRSGMRWSQKGGQNVLNLKTAVKSNRWDTLWGFYQGASLRPAA